jgi:hypothetical protein
MKVEDEWFSLMEKLPIRFSQNKQEGPKPKGINANELIKNSLFVGGRPLTIYNLDLFDNLFLKKS